MLTDLEGVASLITKSSVNFHKVNKSRKTRDYLVKQKAYLNTYWAEFVNISKKFPSEDISILVEQTEECYQALNTEISEGLDRLSDPSASSSASSSGNYNQRLRSASCSSFHVIEGEFSTSDDIPVPETLSTISSSSPVPVEANTNLIEEEDKNTTTQEDAAKLPTDSSITTVSALAEDKKLFTINTTSKSINNIMSTLTLPEALRLVPEFDGNKAQLHQFINACETVLTLIAEENKVNFFKVLKLKLKDKAYDIVKYDTLKDFDELRIKLMNQFLETRTLETIQMELVTVKQKSHENETDFANRVERLLSDLNTACIPANTADSKSKPIIDLNARTALRAFQEGLREPIKLLVKASRFSTLKAATDAAISEGKQYPLPDIKQRPNNQYSQSKFCSHCRRSGHTFDECRLKLKCTRCQRFGHSVGQCRDKMPQNHNQFRAQVSVVTCKYCKNVGHNIDQCRKLEYNRKNNINSGNPRSPTPRATVAATELAVIPAQH